MAESMEELQVPNPDFSNFKLSFGARGAILDECSVLLSLRLKGKSGEKFKFHSP